jgi:hypothetical protein
MCEMRCIVIALSLIVPVGTSLAQQKPTDRFDKVVNRMVKAINESDYPGIAADFGKIMRDAFPMEQLKPFFQNLSAQLGKIEKLDPPRFVPPMTAIYPAHFERGLLDIRIVLDNEDKIIGLLFLPHTADIPIPKKHETTLSLPFKGNWLVLWGGDTKELNQHHDVPNQRFAFDFVVSDRAGKTHKGQGESNEDYYAFGKEILAPRDGIVTDVIQGVRDNVPGSMNGYSALGNAVFIQHREHEVSILAHLKHGSIKVKVGDKIKRGQVIALCGNSGNSSEPHLHYHLQNTPIIQDGTGIKVRFDKVAVTRGGKKQTKRNYSPIKADTISPEEPGGSLQQ